MLRLSKHTVTIFVIGALATAACSHDPQKYVKSGDAFMAQGKKEEATIQYRKALQENPRDGAAHFKLAEAYAALDDLPKALPEYARAADLLPDDLELQLKTGNILLVARRYEDAKTRARTVLQHDPNSIPGLVLLGNSLAALQDLKNAIAATEKAVALDPDRSGTERNLGILSLANGNLGLAETAFKKAIAKDPKSIPARLAIANLYMTVGRLPEAEQALKQALVVDPKNVKANQMLGSFYVDSRRPRLAEPYLRAVADVEDSAEAFIALADYYIGIGAHQQGLEVLRKASTKKGAYSVAQMRIAMVMFASGQRKEAHGVLKEIIAREPKNGTALAFEANLLVSEQRLDEAIKIATEAVSVDPKSSQAQLTLGKIYFAKRDLESARRSFNEALKLDPSLVDADVQLARLHLIRREIDTSIQFAEQAIKYAPDRLDAHLSLVRSLIAREETLPRAVVEMRNLTTRYPESSDVHAMMGRLLMADGKHDLARTAFARALQLDPNCFEALGGLTALDTAAKRMNEARARLEAQLARTPRDPDVLLMAAKFYSVQRDRPQTEQILKRLIEADPTGIEGYDLLGQLYVTGRRLPEAKQQFQELARRDPKSVAALTMLGLLSQSERNLPEAQSWYEKALQIDPLAALAANNLAWIYAVTGTNLDIALQLARTARVRAPESAQIEDTIGWLYYKKDMATLAIQPLEESINREPQNPVFHYHLGLVFARLGNDANARASLERALKLNPRFEGAEEAARVLRTLVY